MNTYKVYILGASGCGKSNSIKRLLGNQENSQHIPTMGVEVYIHHISTTRFNIWDIAGDPNYLGLGDGYLMMANYIFIANVGDLKLWKEMAATQPTAIVKVINIGDLKQELEAIA